MEPSRQRGRPRRLDGASNRHARSLYLAGRAVPSICRELGISPATFFRYLNTWNIRVLEVGILDSFGWPVSRYNALPHGKHPAHFDIAVTRLLADRLGMRIRFHPLPLAELLQGCADGAFAMAIGQLGQSPARTRRLAFSEPYGNANAEPNMGLVARRPLRLIAGDSASLGGLRISVVNDSLCAEWLAHNAPLTTRVKLFGKPSNAHAALLAGRVDADVAALTYQRWFVAQHAEFEIKAAIAFGSVKPALAFSHDNQKLLGQVSEHVLALKRDFTIERLAEQFAM